LGEPNLLDLGGRFAPRVLLHVYAAIAAHLGLSPLTQSGHRLGTHAVQSRGGLVSSLVELGARANSRQDNLKGGALGLGMDVHRDPTAVVADAETSIDVDLDVNVLAVAG